MGVFKRKDSANWWYRFRWDGREVCRTTKQANKRVAEQMEAAHKAGLAKGEVGIRERAKCPTLREFAEGKFADFLRQRLAAKPRTMAYYTNGIEAVLSHSTLAGLRLDEIRQEHVTGFIEHLKGRGYEVSTVNRKLEALRRMLKLAQEWEVTERRLPVVRLLPGERRRERVLAGAEYAAYLSAAVQLGNEQLAAYQRALGGIRAAIRGESPIPPHDPFVLRDVAVVLFECGLRPEECYRLRWDEITEGKLRISHGKTASARRVIPIPQNALGVLHMRRQFSAESEWVFSAGTKSGHIDQSTLKKSHRKACELAGVEYFVPYTLRHSCLTRWAAVMDPYTLAYLAGHSDFATTRRYVHPREEQVLEAMARASSAKGGNDSGYSEESPALGVSPSGSAIN